MEKEQAERLLTLFDEKQAQRPSSGQLELISKWLALFSEMHRRELNPISMMAYIEGLKDLTAEEIQCGFNRCLKEVDRMPTVAHVRDRRNPVTIPEDYVRTELGERGCSICDYTGWKMIPNPSGGMWATKCDCRRTRSKPE
jgi:hypothetical protein